MNLLQLIHKESCWSSEPVIRTLGKHTLGPQWAPSTHSAMFKAGGRDVNARPRALHDIDAKMYSIP